MTHGMRLAVRWMSRETLDKGKHIFSGGSSVFRGLLTVGWCTQLNSLTLPHPRSSLSHGKAPASLCSPCRGDGCLCLWSAAVGDCLVRSFTVMSFVNVLCSFHIWTQPALSHLAAMGICPTASCPPWRRATPFSRARSWKSQTVRTTPTHRIPHCRHYCSQCQ